MKTIIFIVILMISLNVAGQTAEENRNLVFDSLDLKIIEKADSILSSPLAIVCLTPRATDLA